MLRGSESSTRDVLLNIPSLGINKHDFGVREVEFEISFNFFEKDFKAAMSFAKGVWNHKGKELPAGGLASILAR